MEYGRMRKPRPPHPLNPQTRAEAIEWLLRFSEAEVDAAARGEFNEWLRTSPEHVRAYLRVAAFWQEAGHIDGKQGPRDIDALVSHAGKEGNVFPLALGPHSTAVAADNNLFQRSRRLVAIAATIVVMAGAALAYQHLTRDIYETRIGEQRTVNLPDGSTLVLNADSRIRVHYSDTERTIDLDAGQALFKVARNPARPFVVRSADASVRAVGTQFDVYRKANGTTVTVVEGKVKALASGIGSAAPVFLTAGEQLTIPKIDIARTKSRGPGATDPAPEVRPVKVEEATAWTAGLLVFDGAPLADVVQEFNRQNIKPLVIENDPELALLRISGSFPANGSERITRFLEERFGVVVDETRDDIRLSRR